MDEVRQKEQMGAVQEENKLIHDFSEEKPVKKNFLTKNILIMFMFISLLGIGSGFGLYVVKGGNISSESLLDGNSASVESIKKGQTFGTADEENFKDTAEGVMREGGIDGEGAYHLERMGGESQNVYLTSSAVDLSIFIGKKVKVWGETNSAKKAGWLMDVGRLQVLE